MNISYIHTVIENDLLLFCHERAKFAIKYIKHTQRQLTYRYMMNIVDAVLFNCRCSL